MASGRNWSERLISPANSAAVEDQPTFVNVPIRSVRWTPARHDDQQPMEQTACWASKFADDSESITRVLSAAKAIRGLAMTGGTGLQQDSRSQTVLYGRKGNRLATAHGQGRLRWPPGLMTNGHGERHFRQPAQFKVDGGPRKRRRAHRAGTDLPRSALESPPPSKQTRAWSRPVSSLPAARTPLPAWSLRSGSSRHMDPHADGTGTGDAVEFASDAAQRRAWETSQRKSVRAGEPQRGVRRKPLNGC